jgi:hypothetical protein
MNMIAFWRHDRPIAFAPSRVTPQHENALFRWPVAHFVGVREDRRILTKKLDEEYYGEWGE